MIEQYVGWIEQIRSALDKWGSWSIPGDYRMVVVAGMGGSGIVGDYLVTLSHVYGGIPVSVVKYHVPPRFIDNRDLVIVVSYSGNTLETIKFFEKVREYTRNIVIVSSDGLLEEIAGRENYVFIPIPRGYVPRTSLPYMLVTILGLLDSSGYRVVDKGIVEDALEFLENSLEEVKGIGGEVAEFIDRYRGLLVLASHSPYESLLIRGKNEFNENSKIPVKVECAPEWMHNDIVGWEKPCLGNKYVVLAIKDSSDSIGSNLVDYMVGVYRSLDIPVYELVLKGSGLLDRLLYGSLLLGFASVFLAIRRGVDPIVTMSIEKYKGVVKRIFNI